MKISIRRLIVVVAITLSAVAASQEPRRQMNLRQGPESVFDVSPGEIFSSLANATATEQNGRVGNELAFWGYRLESGREVYLVACALTGDVDCEARERRVCPANFEVMSRGTRQGVVRHVTCKPVAVVAPGDIRPGCSDSDLTQDLYVSLIGCF